MKTRTMFLVPILSVAGLLFAIPCFPGVPPLYEDSDEDSLCNKCEREIFGTNPSKIDTDEDGIPDRDEDHDGDGLTNLEELNNIVALMDAIGKGDTEGVVALLDYGPYVVIGRLSGGLPWIWL